MADNNIILKVIDYIEDNLDGELSLDEVADNVGYSKFHLNRLFSESVGCTLYKYIQTRRLTVAAEKLVNTRKAYANSLLKNFIFRRLFVYNSRPNAKD